MLKRRKKKTKEEIAYIKRKSKEGNKCGKTKNYSKSKNHKNKNIKEIAKKQIERNVKIKMTSNQLLN